MNISKKQRLQEVTEYKVMSVKECLNALEWTYTEEENNYKNITCPCGGEMEFGGYLGTETAECLKCGKHMVDLFSPIQVSSSSCAILNPDDYELDGNRHWIVVDGNGGIMYSVVNA